MIAWHLGRAREREIRRDVAVQQTLTGPPKGTEPRG